VVNHGPGGTVVVPHSPSFDALRQAVDASIVCARKRASAATSVAVPQWQSGRENGSRFAIPRQMSEFGSFKTHPSLALLLRFFQGVRHLLRAISKKHAELIANVMCDKQALEKARRREHNDKRFIRFVSCLEVRQ